MQTVLKHLVEAMLLIKTSHLNIESHFLDFFIVYVFYSHSFQEVLNYMNYMTKQFREINATPK